MVAAAAAVENVENNKINENDYFMRDQSQEDDQ
jgi:hypothetical protein